MNINNNIFQASSNHLKEIEPETISFESVSSFIKSKLLECRSNEISLLFRILKQRKSSQMLQHMVMRWLTLTAVPQQKPIFQEHTYEVNEKEFRDVENRLKFLRNVACMMSKNKTVEQIAKCNERATEEEELMEEERKKKKLLMNKC
ncbi:CLUMA_CG007385, isoform A [Clunio marinus]|uniref:CLUMA_CG007385, isoform A n=1 Tax=Clunio marinus TaxID=568069 RepID=A0A1J1I265_9DIPT|nr:CLUMA_CG007385, isoform A [Clunio marinus]